MSGTKPDADQHTEFSEVMRPGASSLIPAGVLTLMGLTGMVLLLVLATRPAPAPANAPAPEPLAPEAFLQSLVIPDFALIDQNGRPVDPSIFDGRFTLLAFTFTNCPTICPIMHAQLLRVQHELASSSLGIVTISVDPERDTPEALRQYMQRLQIDADRWTMLTGERGAIESIARALRLGYTINPNDQIPLKNAPGTMANIDHSSKLVLVGPDRAIVDLASGLEWPDIERLVELARYRPAENAG